MPPAQSGALLVVACATAAQVVNAMSNLLLPTIAPEVARSLNVDPALIGYQVSLLFGAAMIGSFFSGNAVLRWGAARSTQVCSALCAVALLLFAVPTIASIVLGSIALGLASALSAPAAAQLIVTFTEPHRRNLMFSIKQTGVPIGGLLIALVAPTLAITVGWRWALPLVIALAVLVIAIIEPRRKVWDAGRREEGGAVHFPFGGIPFVWARPVLRWLSWVGLCFGAVQRSLMTFTVVFLVAEADYTLVEAGVALSIVQVAGVAGRLFWGWLADRLKASVTVLLLIAGLTAASCVLLMTVSGTWPKGWVYAIFFIAGLASLGWNGVLHAETARNSPPGTIAIVSSASSVFIHAGILVLPALFVAAYSVLGSYSRAFGLLLAVSITSLALLAVTRRAGREAGRVRL